ncbi:MAG: phenylacetate--CoA ligase family protein [Calditrichaeota bacterium]|nr:MAG: phenylacetate--CoA ligase family protein [Calditrichota bacterium]
MDFDIQQIAAKFLLDPLFASYEKSNHIEQLEFYERSQYFPKEQVEQIQIDLLKKMLLHSYKHCPFYTKRFDAASFDPVKFQSFDDLQKLPVLTKSDIQNNLNELKASSYNQSELIENKTGGSTGSPLLFYHDRKRLFSRKASTYRHDRWTGWDIGYKSAYLWGHHRDFRSQLNWKSKIRAEFYDRKMVLDTSDITTEKMTTFVNELLSFNPFLYVAYANAMYLFARFIKENNIENYHRPEAIITSAELLTGEQRALIEEVFECKVYNRYGCRETSIVASECSMQKGMHISAETLFVELDKSAKSESAPAKIIITDLLNFGMPLIRYRIEDMGVAVEGDCDCGRELPRLDIAGGRVTDFLVTADSRVVSGAAMTIYFVATVAGIAQAQLIQKAKDELHLKIVKSKKFTTETEPEIEQNVKNFFGEKMKHTIEYVDSIPTTASGKYRFSISEIDVLEFLS